MFPLFVLTLVYSGILYSLEVSEPLSSYCTTQSFRPMKDNISVVLKVALNERLKLQAD